MNIWLGVLIVVALLCFGGGFYSPGFRGPGIGIGGILVLVLLFLLLTGRL